MSALLTGDGSGVLGDAELAHIIVNEMFQLVGILDAQGINLQSNRTSLEAAGLSREEVIGRPFWLTAWWPPETREEVKAAVQRAGSGEFVRYEVGIHGRPGEGQLFLDFSLKPVKDETGAVRYIIAEGRDITAKKQAEAEVARKNDELRTLYERLKDLDQAKSQFFANVSHELRTPLALILARTERLGESAEGTKLAESARDVQEIERHARSLLTRVNDLLDLAKLDESQLQLDYAEVDLAALMRLVASSFESLAVDRNIGFHVQTPEQLLAAVDSDKVERILMNLLANAFKFTPAGVVRCSLTKLAERAVLRVADSGPGVAPQHHGAIFERFFQVEGGSTRRFGGVGLGLSLVRDFALLHGGSASVADAPEGGAEFTIELPLQPAKERGVSVAPPRSTSRSAPLLPTELQVSRTESRRDFSIAEADDGRALVLLVEDNPDMRRYLAELLAKTYRVVTASDGQEGVEKAAALCPDLVLTDVMMPKLSGDELLRALRAVPALDGVPVVIMTAKADEELRVKLLREGAQDYLTKPVAAQELSARLGNLIAIRRTRAVLEKELQGRTGTLETLARELGARKRELSATLAELELRERQLRQTQKMEAIGNLAAGVAHDFNNLLTVILGSCALLDSDLGPDPVARESLQAIDAAGVRAARLTGQLLAFSRQQVMALQVVNLDEVICSMHSMLSRLIGENLDFRVAAASRLGMVKVDRSQIEQVILNLVVNARDAMPQGGSLTIATANVDSNVELVVTDTGLGMDEETRQRIFDPFFTTKAHSKGTGLGLSTVFGIVKQSGGEIEVKSQPGRGATFTIRLPRTDEVAPVETVGPVRSSPRGCETILLVEDDEHVRASVRRILERSGYEVLVARSGTEALSLQQEFSGTIQLLLTDVVMPGMTGVELADSIAATRPHIKLLFMSGYTSDIALHPGVSGSASSGSVSSGSVSSGSVSSGSVSSGSVSEFLQKPITPELLTRKVRDILDLPVRP